MRIARYFGLAVLTLAVASVGVFRAADNDPKYTIKEVMKEAHKDKLVNKVALGKASDDEKKRLLVVVNRAIDLVCTVGRTLKSGTAVNCEVADVGS